MKTIIENRGLTYFSNRDVNSSKLIKADKILHNGVFKYWLFELEDENFHTYEWKDFTLSSIANKTQIRSAIISHFVNNIVKLPYPSQLDTIERNPQTIISDSPEKTTTIGGGTQGVGNYVRDNATL